MTGRAAGRRSVGARVRAALRRVLTENATPARLGWSVGLGAFIGCSPAFGLQTLLGFGAAWLFRLNRVATVTATNVSMPPLTPLIVFAEVQLGALVLTGRLLGLGLADFRGAGAVALARSLVGAWVLGSVLVGGAVGAALGLLTAAVARARRRAADESPTPPAGPPAADPAGPTDDQLAAAARRAAARFATAPPRIRHYVRWKYRLDPGYAAAAGALAGHAARADARLCDLGCGLGLLALLLKEAGAAAAIVGLDWDAAQLALARAAAGDLPGLELVDADLVDAAVPPCDAAALIDVLHYHPPAAQDALLARVAAALAPGGRLVVREVDLAGGMRLGRALERLAARLGWHRTAGAFHYRPAAELAAVLRGLGLAVTVTPAGGWLTRANVLLVADRPPGGHAAA